jgi:two-component system KDP operon response regulator KdpE
VDVAATKGEALDALATRPPDAMVLDLVLPDGTGVEVCQDLRRWSTLPVIVLSAVGDEREKVRALDAGADDYVTKPFGSEELTARLRAVLRRATEADVESAVTAGDLTVDIAARRVTVRGEEVHLTPIEFDLLRILAMHRGKLVMHRQLLQEVWGPAYADETHYLRVHIAHIRAKIEDDPSRPRLILTDPGVGYRLQLEP